MNEEEKKGYSRGYAAGRRKARNELFENEVLRGKAQAWLSSYNSVLPSAMDSSAWQKGGKPITSIKDRSDLAADFADLAIKNMSERFGPSCFSSPYKESDQ